MEKNAYSESYAVGKGYGGEGARADAPPKMSVTGFAGFLKGKSGLTFYERRSDIKF